MENNISDGWSEQEKLVLHELKRLAESHENLIEKINGYEMRNLEQHAKINAEIVQLKVKSGAWGAVAGTMTAIMIILAAWIGTQIKNTQNNEQREQTKFNRSTRSIIDSSQK